MPTLRKVLLSLTLLLTALACGLPRPAPTATPIPSQTPPPPTATEAPTLSPTAALPTAGPPGDPAIEIQGPPAFVEQAEAALDLLGQCDPEALATADIQLEAIVHSDRSGMDVASGTFLVADTTAFAPGYSQSLQVFWFAGTIIHDARHRWQSYNGMTANWDQMTLAEREGIEHDARGVQIESLERCRSQLPEEELFQADNLIGYLTDMQTGAIPCDYCDTEWAERDW